MSSYFITDIESGQTIEVNKEQYDRHNIYLKHLSDIFEAAKPKIDPNVKLTGKLIIFGTGGEIENSNFEDLFYKPKHYNIIKKDD